MTEKDISLEYMLNVPPISPDVGGMGSLLSLFLSDMFEDIRWGLLQFNDNFEVNVDHVILDVPTGWKIVVTELIARQRTVNPPSGAWRIGSNPPDYDNWHLLHSDFSQFNGIVDVGMIRVTPFDGTADLNDNTPAITIPVIEGPAELRLNKIGGPIGASIDLSTYGIAWRTTD